MLSNGYSNHQQQQQPQWHWQQLEEDMKKHETCNGRGRTINKSSSNDRIHYISRINQKHNNNSNVIHNTIDKHIDNNIGRNIDKASKTTYSRDTKITIVAGTCRNMENTLQSFTWATSIASQRKSQNNDEQQQKQVSKRQQQL